VIGRTQKRFWKFFGRLPPQVQKLAREKYALWKLDAYHRSLHFEERRNGICVVRIGEHHRALGLREGRHDRMVLDRHTRGIQPFSVLIFSRVQNLISDP